VTPNAESLRVAGPAPLPGWLRSAARVVLLALLALPLGAATWAFADYAAARERAAADERLEADLDAAISGYGAELEDAARRATALAASPRVQTALAEKDLAELRRLRRSLPAVSFVLDGGAVGTPSPPSRSVVVRRGTRRLGRVVVSVRLDGPLLARLARRATLPRGDELRLVPVGGVATQGRPVTIALEGEVYRAVAAPVESAPRGAALAAVRPIADIDAAVDRIRDRVVLTGLVAFAGVVLLAYVLAPAVARGRQLRAQRAQAVGILSHVRDGILLVDDRGIVRFWSPAAEAATGLPARSVVGARAEDVVPGWEAIDSRVRPSTADELRPGVTVPVLIGGVEARLSVEAVVAPEGTVYAFRDVTEAERLEAMRREIVATVSHEVRTPLTAIYGAALTLRERSGELPEEQARELLGLVAGQSEHLTRLVDQILLASQLETRGVVLKDETLDAATAARDVAAAARAAAPAGIAIRVEVIGGTLLVHGDGDKLRQALANLVENAVKYSPDGGEVRIVLRPEDGVVRISVHDEGIGIPPAERERVFEKFFRLDPDLRRGVGGAGLGLSICRALVEQMHGRVWVEPGTGRGSTFVIELPAAVERRAPTQPAA
jgi:two-component system phosphate regulon sensor histidine kinase PhoR